jgi:hypothetical protein
MSTTTVIGKIPTRLPQMIPDADSDTEKTRLACTTTRRHSKTLAGYSDGGGQPGWWISREVPGPVERPGVCNLLRAEQRWIFWSIPEKKTDKAPELLRICHYSQNDYQDKFQNSSYHTLQARLIEYYALIRREAMNPWQSPGRSCRQCSITCNMAVFVGQQGGFDEKILVVEDETSSAILW